MCGGVSPSSTAPGAWRSAAYSAAVGCVLCGGGRRRPLRLGGAVLDEEPSVLGEEAASSVCSSVLDEEAGERRR